MRTTTSSQRRTLRTYVVARRIGRARTSTLVSRLSGIDDDPHNSLPNKVTLVRMLIVVDAAWRTSAPRVLNANLSHSGSANSKLVSSILCAGDTNSHQYSMSEGMHSGKTGDGSPDDTSGGATSPSPSTHMSISPMASPYSDMADLPAMPGIGFKARRPVS